MVNRSPSVVTRGFLRTIDLNMLGLTAVMEIEKLLCLVDLTKVSWPQHVTTYCMYMLK